ncbi:tldc domain-containing protein [Stylonychia lemnae]|uniref:Tldc domain-containing protein n=1 Tax=Stylonychia lemnae TaxID=5949 RepID=A0A078APG9_STYLE|nr:tldc domain-containing protein [Stylonychia lemnae]|eukprot:CDW84039.1 tldc domain-containing protein [Stylonychia lemnae]
MEKIVSLNFRQNCQKFKKFAEIKSGTFGTVCKVQDLTNGQMVAHKQQDLKKLITDPSGISRSSLRLIREIASFSLHHPNILETKEAYFDDENNFIIISELAEQDLEKYKMARSMSASEISFIMLQIIEGLDHVHKKGFIHRDISPENILVFKDGIFKICDFGVAAQGDSTQQFTGKLNYMAPEVKFGEEYDKNADIWSLGMLLYYLCFGDSQLKEINIQRKNSQQVEMEGFPQFEDIFNKMTTYSNNDKQARFSLQQLRQDFKKLVNSSQYLEYQKMLLNYQLESIKQSNQQNHKLYCEYLQIHENFDELLKCDAIQEQIKKFQKDSLFQQEQIKRYIVDKAAEKIKLQSKVQSCEIVIQKKSNEMIQQLKKQLAEQEPQFRKEFKRLVEPYVNQDQQQQRLLFKLQGQCSLLYKASKHGFTASDFHSRCDNQGPSITFILSDHGKVFGGYTSVPWKTPELHYQAQKDSTAYIFSLTETTLHPVNQNFVDHAIGHYKKQILQFGLGDIQIEDQCNLKYTNSCNIGSTYKPPSGYKQGDQKIKEYLAGANKFRVLEIEVYKIEQ